MVGDGDNGVAIVALPVPGQLGRIAPRHRSWLARADFAQESASMPLYEAILGELGRSLPDAGLGALRLWGQTGERPTTWIAAADPVYLEPRVGSLCLHALGPAAVSATELARLAQHLEVTLGGGEVAFSVVGDQLYVSSARPFATATAPASAVHGERPDEHLPAGPDARAQRRLVSEIEMALHDHAVNLERAAAGRPPVNGLWLWGGGEAPAACRESLPPLVGDDAVLKGYWRSRGEKPADWPGSVPERGLGGAGLVAVLPAPGAARPGVLPEEAHPPAGEPLDGFFEAMRRALARGGLDRVVFRFAGGVRAEMNRTRMLRVWRREHPLLARVS